jgi:hypothetical protein
MRAAKRTEEFKIIQRESRQVLAVLRRALSSLRVADSPSPVADAPSPVQGGLARLPSPSGGPGRRLAWALRTSTTGTYYPSPDNVTDRRNSTLRWYFRHCG